MKLDLLANNKYAIPILANWYFKEWGHLSEGNTIDRVKKGLNRYLNIDMVPLIVLAIEDGAVLGSAQQNIKKWIFIQNLSIG